MMTLKVIQKPPLTFPGMSFTQVRPRPDPERWSRGFFAPRDKKKSRARKMEIWGRQGDGVCRGPAKVGP